MAWLDEVEEAGLVASQGSVLRCKHDLVADAALALSMHGVQTYARVRIAELLEREADESNSVELLGDCVTHWELSGETKRAYQAAMKLGHRLVALGMGEDAEKAFERAKTSAESARERVLAFDGQIVACHLAANWKKVRLVAQSRSEEAGKVRPAIPATSDNDILVAEAALCSILGGEPPLALVNSIASDNSQNPNVRCRAAALLAICGDNYFDAAIVRHSLMSVADLGPTAFDLPEGVLLGMIYNIIVGEPTVATEFTRKLRSASQHSPDFSMRIQGLRRVGTAFLRLGQLDDAHEAIELSLTTAKKLHLPLQELACFENLFSVALARGDLELAECCLQDILRCKDSEPDFVEILSIAAESKLAWVAEDGTRAHRVFQRVTRLEEPKIPRVLQTFHTICEAMSLLSRRHTYHSSSLRCLEEFHFRGRSFGDQDFAASVLFSSLRMNGRTADANELAQSYVYKHRREAFQPPACYRLSL